MWKKKSVPAPEPERRAYRTYEPTRIAGGVLVRPVDGSVNMEAFGELISYVGEEEVHEATEVVDGRGSFEAVLVRRPNGRSEYWVRQLV